MQSQEGKNNGNGKRNGRANGNGQADGNGHPLANGHSHGNGNGYEREEKQQPADTLVVGRILVEIWSTNTGPVFRFNAAFRYWYGNGSTKNIPVQAFPDLRIASYKAKKRIRQLEKLQHIPGWVRLIKLVLGA